MHCAVISKNILARDRSRFFDQVGHQITSASIENKHFNTDFETKVNFDIFNTVCSN